MIKWFDWLQGGLLTMDLVHLISLYELAYPSLCFEIQKDDFK